MKKLLIALVSVMIVLIPGTAYAADGNTVYNDGGYALTIRDNAGVSYNVVPGTTSARWTNDSQLFKLQSWECATVYVNYGAGKIYGPGTYSIPDSWNQVHVKTRMC